VLAPEQEPVTESVELEVVAAKRNCKAPTVALTHPERLEAVVFGLRPSLARRSRLSCSRVVRSYPPVRAIAMKRQSRRTFMTMNSRSRSVNRLRFPPFDSATCPRGTSWLVGIKRRPHVHVSDPNCRLSKKFRDEALAFGGVVSSK
jgi:hypothetical protein